MTKSTRPRDEAEFAHATKEALAKRAGYRCSFPQCGSVTVGPSGEGENRTAATGMACHIRAAANGPAARRVSGDTPEALRNISNGTWMCYRHGKLIDTDEVTYTINQLARWRSIAERRAALSHALGRDVPLWQDDQVHDLARTDHDLESTDDLGAVVNAILSEASAFEVWGEEPVLAIRDLLIELTRNAFDHGAARTVTVSVEARGIRLVNDGHAFGLADLRRHTAPGGGAAALQALTGSYGAHVIASGRREEDRNVVNLGAVRRASDLVAATPCHVQLSARGRLEQSALERVADCDTVYLISGAFWSYSDRHAILGSVQAAQQTGKAVIVAVPRMSSGVRNMMAKFLDGVTVIELPGESGRAAE